MSTAFISMVSFAVGVGCGWLAYHHLGSVIAAAVSFVAVVFALVLFWPVVGNQTVEVGDRSIAVRTFGRSVELTGEHLTEVRKSCQLGFSVFSFQIGLLDVFFVKEWRKHCYVFA